MPFTRRRFLASLAAPRRRTNVVVFLTDDHGPWATAPTGCAEMHTPTLSALAREGVRFTRAFACTPVSSPSRMTLMTGLIPSQHGVQDWLVPKDSFGEISRRWLEGFDTWSEVLAANGYTLGMCGKWHMGHDDRAQAGFSYWATVPGGGGTYRNPDFVKNGEPFPVQGFKTDAVGDCALEFLDQQKNRRQPFALYMPFYAPHTPYDYQPDVYRRPYLDSRFSCFPNLPKHRWQNPGLAQHHGNAESKRSYSALISGVDANVRRVLDKLDRMGAREDTVILFTADQGWNAGHHGVWGKGNGTWPFNMYEESIGVPMIWSHPGRMAGNRVVDTLVSHYDFFPTLVDYLGLRWKPSSFRAGESYAALLGGTGAFRRDRLYFEYCGVRAVRTANAKLVRRDTGEDEYFDLSRDPGEAKNLWPEAAQSAEGKALDADLDAFFRRAGAPALREWRKTTRQSLTVYRQG